MALSVWEDTLSTIETPDWTTNPNHASSRIYLSQGQSRQLIIENFNKSIPAAQYFILDFETVLDILNRTLRLHSVIHASLNRKPPSTIQSILICSQKILSSLHNVFFRSQSPKPTSAIPTENQHSPHCCRNIIFRTFLDSCEKFIREFIQKVESDMCVCKSTDVQNFQRGLQDRLEYLVGSLCHDRQLEGGTGNRLQEMDPVIDATFQYLWQYHSTSLPRRVSRGNLTALDRPVLLFDASINGGCIPIPRVFCDSKEKLHQLLCTLFENRSWYAKVDKEEYVLENKELTTVIDTVNWQRLVVPGAEIYMTITVKRRGAISSSCCRICRAVNIESLGHNGKIACMNCGRITDAINVGYTNYVETKGHDEEAFPRVRYLHYRTVEDVIDYWEKKDPDHETWAWKDHGGQPRFLAQPGGPVRQFDW